MKHKDWLNTMRILGPARFCLQENVGDKKDKLRIWPRNFEYEEYLFFQSLNQLGFERPTVFRYILLIRLLILKDTTGFVSRSMAMACELSHLLTEKFAWFVEKSHKTAQELNTEANAKWVKQIVQNSTEIRL